MERQVIAEGTVTRVSREEADAYFHSRPRASQLAAWASPQSTVVAGRAVIEESYRVVEKKYEGREVPLPPHWGGYRLEPATVEFWQGRRSRLHDRLRYRRDPGSDWVVERLAP
jgi:pyridoxamine 5'-phosphate oxidase